MSVCHFIKEYNDPKNEYSIISLSLFYMPQYIRQFYNNARNVTVERQLKFIYNLLSNLHNLEHKFYYPNWYLRIYYDDSIFKFKHEGTYIWEDFYNEYKHHNKLQWINYKCPDFMKNNDYHINLFGSIIRFYPFFYKDSKLKMVISADMDNFYTKDYLSELRNFENSNYDFNVFCSKYEVAFYQQKETDCYFRSGMIASKVKFDEKYWNFILKQLKTFSNKDFSNILNNLNKECKIIRPNRAIKSYKNFEYGIDEIIINYYFKKILIAHKYKIRIVRYKPLSCTIFNMFLVYLLWNYDYNFSDQVTDILKALTNENDIDTAKVKFKKMIKRLPDRYDAILPIVNILRKYLPYLKKMKFPQAILNFIENVSLDDYNVKKFDNYFVSLKPPKYLIK